MMPSMQGQKPLSCMACRRRKVRCERPSGSTGIGTSESPLDVCQPCATLGLPCTTPMRKKRGLSERTLADLGSGHVRKSPQVTPATEHPGDMIVNDQTSLYPNSGPDQPNTQRPRAVETYNTDVEMRIPEMGYWRTHSIELSAMDKILARDKIFHVVSMFFDFVAPLQPIIHQPSFLSRLDAHHDRTDPMFLSLLAIVVAVGLVQVPKRYATFEDSTLTADIADQCYRLSRDGVLDMYDPPTDTLIVIRYFTAVFHFMAGRKAAWTAGMGETTRLAFYMEMHREGSYAGLNPVEAEMRRRLMRTLLLSDSSAASLQGQVPAMDPRDVDIIHFSDIDDEYITVDGVNPIPLEHTSRLIGFRAGCATFSLIRETVSLRRRLDRSPGAAGLLDILGDLGDIHDRLHQHFLSLHPILQVGPEDGIEYMNLPISIQGNEMPWHVMKANLHSNRAIARMLLINYREELRSMSGLPGTPIREEVETVLLHTGIGNESMESNITDLLHALTSIPIDAVAANSLSLVNKVRNIAVTLLDPDPVPDAASPAKVPTGRYESVLIAFLTLLTQIENARSGVPEAIR